MTIKTIAAVAAGIIMSVSCGDGTQSNSSGADPATVKSDTTSATGKLRPKGAKPQWAPDGIDDEMLVVIEKLQSYGAPPIETLDAKEARKQPTPATAVMDVMKENNVPMPPAKVDTVGKDIPGNIHVRIYTPKGTTDTLPVIVYYHGGGWVIADLDTYNASAQGMAEQANAIVVSVHYRQGPENKFPAAHNDAFTAYQWVVKNATSMKGNPDKIALVGESAGGNLACNVSIMARDKKITMPVYQVLVYPVAQSDMNTASYTKYAAAKPLNKPMMEWFVKNALPSPATASDPRISLVKANLASLPATTVITATIDPLHDDGQMLSDKLKEAGVKVNYKNYDGVTHEFFGMATAVPKAKDAQALAAGDLISAFKK